MRPNSTHQVYNEFVEEDVRQIGSGSDEESDDSGGTFARECEFSDGRSGGDERRMDCVELLLVDTIYVHSQTSSSNGEKGSDAQTVSAARNAPNV